MWQINGLANFSLKNQPCPLHVITGCDQENILPGTLMHFFDEPIGIFHGVGAFIFQYEKLGL